MQTQITCLTQQNLAINLLMPDPPLNCPYQCSLYNQCNQYKIPKIHKISNIKNIKCIWINQLIFTIIYNQKCNKNSRQISLAICIKNMLILTLVRISIILLHKLGSTFMLSKDPHNQYNKIYSQMIETIKKRNSLLTPVIGTISKQRIM